MAGSGPFPGMDPWLEAYWGNVHASLAAYARDELNEQLGGGLLALAEERVYIELPTAETRAVSPDVYVVQHREPVEMRASSAGVAVVEPIMLRMLDDEVREPFVQIIDARSGGRIITIIEFVSPSNKLAGEGRRLYEQKQAETFDSDTSLVEVDLTRSGTPVTLAAKRGVQHDYRVPWHASVRRAWRRKEIAFYPIGLRQPLPAIEIPLRKEDKDIILNLQDLIDTAYTKGRFAELLDYTRPPIPPLDPADQQWAAQHVEQWRKGSG